MTAVLILGVSSSKARVRVECGPLGASASNDSGEAPSSRSPKNTKPRQALRCPLGEAN